MMDIINKIDTTWTNKTSWPNQTYLNSIENKLFELKITDTSFDSIKLNIKQTQQNSAQPNLTQTN